MKTKKVFFTIQKYVIILAALGLLFMPQPLNSSYAANTDKPATAEWLVDSGENHIWYQIDEDTLIIGGTGEMPDWDWSAGEVTPWYDSRSTITKVIVKDGITRIGSYSFRGEEANKYSSNIEEFILPSTLTSIGDYAFRYNGSLTVVVIKNPIPPMIGNGVINDTNEGMAFAVPASARNTYLNSEYWKLDEGTGEGYLIDIDGWSNALSAYFVYITSSDGGSVSSVLDYQYEDLSSGESFECGEDGCEYIFADLYPLLTNPPLVTLTATPDSEYSLISLTVTDEDGTNIPLNEDNSFTMPAKSVTINAVFDNIPGVPDTGIVH